MTLECCIQVQQTRELPSIAGAADEAGAGLGIPGIPGLEVKCLPSIPDSDEQCDL
jgi:hypothetical protein